MRIPIRATAAAAVAAAAVVTAATPAFATTSSPASASEAGHAVFVQTDNTAGNHVVAYDRAADGTLTPAGSYATGGRGRGAARLDQGPDGTYPGDPGRPASQPLSRKARPPGAHVRALAHVGCPPRTQQARQKPWVRSSTREA